MKKISWKIVLTFVFAMLLLAACGGQEPEDETVVVTATAESEPVCTVGSKPNLAPSEGMKWVFDPDACMWIKVSNPEAPAAEATPKPEATATPAPMDPAIAALIETFPDGLKDLFGTDSKDLGLETKPANEDWARPLSPTTVWPIDEDGGVLSWSTGYVWATIGMVNDNGPIYRFAGPWGGNHVTEIDGEVKANYTYMVFAFDHTTDIGAHQLAGDHYPAGSVSVSSGHPTKEQFAQALMTVVNHTSGVNDEVNPAPRVGIFYINSETGKLMYFEADYFGNNEWEWAAPRAGQLPLVDNWGTMYDIFDVLEP